MMLALLAQAPKWLQAPLADYRWQIVGDFAAQISPKAGRHPEQLSETLQLLAFRLRQLKQEVPPEAYRKLTQVRFWIEYDDPNTPAAVYHPEAAWLSEHGYHPEMAGNIEIGNLKNFLHWQHIQPSMVLHELAHAWQFKFVGADDPAIAKAYSDAVAAHLYENVPYVLGGRRRAYALTNQFEYFAECSEAYFGRNDFYPFLRSEFQSYDPEGFATVKRAWRDEQ